MTTNINELPLDDTGKPNPDFYVKPAGGYSDGYVVVQRGVGIVCECFDDTGKEAKAIAWFMNNRTAVTDLIDKADTAQKALRNLVEAEQVHSAYGHYADDLRAALDRIGSDS